MRGVAVYGKIAKLKAKAVKRKGRQEWPQRTQRKSFGSFGG
jgi:hypothetical protein